MIMTGANMMIKVGDMVVLRYALSDRGATPGGPPLEETGPG